MSLPHLASSLLWYVPITLQSLIAFAMLRRGLARTFPVFFCYTALILIRDITLLLVPFTGNLYSSVFWWGEALAVLFSLAVILEVLWHLFRPYPSLRFVFKLVWIAAFVAVGFGLAILRTGPQGVDRILELSLLLERSARLLQVGLLIVLISMMSRLGLTWHHASLGIAAGFGTYSALDLAALELRGHLHAIPDNAFVLVRSAAYNLGVLIWAYYFLRPRPLQTVESLPETDMESWQDALNEYVKKWYRR